MKQITLLILLLVIGMNTYSQNNILAGRVLYQNSGKKPAVGVIVKPITDANEKETDATGSFELVYTVKKAGSNASLRISERTGDNKQIELVNPEAVQFIRIPASKYDTSTVIVVCQKGERDRNIKKYEEKIKKDATKYRRLQSEYNKQLKGKDIAEAEKVRLTLAIDSLEELYNNTIQTANERAITYAVLNKDFADGVRLKAIEYIEEGEFDKAEKTLEDADTDEECKKALQNLEMAVKGRGIADSINHEADIKEIESLNTIKEAIARKKIEANLKYDRFKYKEAEAIYLELVRIYRVIDYPAYDIAQGYSQLGRIKYKQGYYDLALAYYLKTNAIYDTIYSNKNIAIAALYNNLGLIYDKNEDYALAIVNYERALEINKQFYAKEEQNIAANYINLGIVYRHKGVYDIAIGYFEDALAIYSQYHGEEHQTITRCYSNLGIAYKLKVDYEKAIRYFEYALAIDKQYYGEGNPIIASYYNNLGSVYDSKRDYYKAIDYYDSAIAIGKNYYGEEHPSVGIMYNNLGCVYDNIQEHKKAIDYFKLSIEIKKNYFDESNSIIYNTYSNLSASYKHAYMYIEAIECKSLYIYQYEKSAEHKLDFLSGHYNELGLLHYLNKQYDSAIISFQKAYTIDSSQVNKSHNNNIGTAYVKAKNFKEAKRYFELYETQGIDKGRAYRNWAMYYALSGDKELAIQYLQKAVDNGFNSLQWVKTDDSMEPLKTNELYKKIIAELKK